MKYPMCSLARILNPGTYIVLSTDKEHLSEVQDLEKRMRNEIFEESRNLKLECQMCVAVKDSCGKFSRGIIEEILQEDLYEIYLIDCGLSVLADKSRIYVITNKEFLNVEPLAFAVRLYGVIPATFKFIGEILAPKIILIPVLPVLKSENTEIRVSKFLSGIAFPTYSTVRLLIWKVLVDYLKNSTKELFCRKWSLESQEFIRNFFENPHKIIVQSIFIQDRIVYGDLFVKTESQTKYVSLRKLLCENNLCAFSEMNFKRRENLKFPEEIEDISLKMEFVTKWQKDEALRENKFLCPTSILSKKADSIVCSQTTSNVSESSNILGVGEKELLKPNEKYSAGKGRGKLKFLTAQMRKKEASAGNFGSCISSKIDPFDEHGVSSDRDYLMKKYLERFEESPSFEAKNFHSIKTLPRKNSLENGVITFFSNEFKLINASRLENAAVKFDQFYNSNEPKEDSIFSEDIPPLLNSFLNKKEVNSKSSKNECVFEKLENESRKRNKKKGVNPCSRVGLKDLKTRQNKSCGNNQFWERPTKLRTSSNRCDVFVHFDENMVEPVNTFRELPFRPSVLKNLNKRGGFTALNQTQRWGIPAIRKQLNTVMIGSSKTGKTLSYIVPLADYVQDECYFKELPEGNGPVVVIVASSSHVCESIYETFKTLLGRQNAGSQVKVVLAHGGGSERQIWVSLTNGCDVLISTPHCLQRLLEFTVLTNFERLTCLVLDEVDVITENPFRNSLRVILEKANFSTGERYYQKILCGEKWTPKVESLVKTYVKSHALVMSSYSEAVIHEKLKPRIFLVHHNRKREILMEKLRDKFKTEKIVIFCEKTSDAKMLHSFFLSNGIFSLVAHEHMLAHKFRETQRIWDTLKEVVLVIADEVLYELYIRRPNVLVHYDLPSKSKTNFYLRYSTVLNSHQDTKMYSSTQVKTENIILIDDENHRQLPHIVDFVVRLGGQLPLNIVKKCEEIRRQLEIEKCQIPICDNILSFGRCRKSKSCPRRHQLVKTWDSPTDLPFSGWVNFEILRVHDASHFSVLLLEHIGVNGETSKLDDNRFEISFELTKFFLLKDNWKIHRTPKVGDVCAVKTGAVQRESFLRAKVIEFLTTDREGKPVKVGVKLLDVGLVWERKVNELFELPESLASFPPSAVDVRVVGVQPMDFDVKWSQTANSFVKDLMIQPLEKNQYWSGQIVLALNNTLFLIPVKRKQYLPYLKVHVFDRVLQDEMLNNRIAVENREHLTAMLKLSIDAGIEVSKKNEKNKNDFAKIEPQWAFFDSDFVKVKFLAAENTSTVFLQPMKFEELLELLENDCQTEGTETAKEIRSRKTKKSKTVTITVGMYCLALFEDGRWNRGRIESEIEEKFYVYFVDHGDFQFVEKHNVLPISQSLLLRLPCQAIECRLTGIQDQKECSMTVLKEIYAFSEDGMNHLYAQIVSDSLKAEITNGRKYSLNLTDRKGVSLNKLLVSRNLCAAMESERSYLEDIEIDSSEKEENEEEEEMEMKRGQEDLPQLLAEISTENHFSNWQDDMFKDEEAQDFLKEFASKVGLTKDCQRILKNDSQTTLNHYQDKKALTDFDEAEQAKKREELIEMFNKRKKKNILKLELKNQKGILTPQVLWSQNQLEVQIKILLNNVDDYFFLCTDSNISFRCFLKEKFYAVDLKLFGVVNPGMAKLTVKTFYVVIVLAKFASPLWSRLHLDKVKHRWISLDVESLVDKDGPFSETIKSVKADIDLGILKEAFRSDTIRGCSDTEDSEKFILTDSDEEAEF